ITKRVGDRCDYLVTLWPIEFAELSAGAVSWARLPRDYVQVDVASLVLQERAHGDDHTNMKKRLDILLVERGLADSRAQAQALVLAGLVRGHDKPGQQVAEDVELEVGSLPPYVSRGGEKLAHGLDGLDVDPAELDCV